MVQGAFVSINRFERKKNVALALEAYIELQAHGKRAYEGYRVQGRVQCRVQCRVLGCSL